MELIAKLHAMFWIAVVVFMAALSLAGMMTIGDAGLFLCGVFSRAALHELIGAVNGRPPGGTILSEEDRRQ